MTMSKHILSSGRSVYQNRPPPQLAFCDVVYTASPPKSGRAGFLVELGRRDLPFDAVLLRAIYELGHEVRVRAMDDLARVLVLLPRPDGDAIDYVQLMMLKMQLADVISLWHIPAETEGDECRIRFVTV
jgi:hypothetical protein